MSISLIKAAIKTNLDALVTSTVLGGATVTDIRRNPLNHDTGSFPHAFIMPPALTSEALDNRSNIRTYTFDIMVLFRAEDITGTDDLEEAIEAMVDVFDNDPTLGGTARGGVLPVSSAPEPFQHNGQDLIMVVIQVQAKEDVTLTFA
jgi:hypothetical protein